MTVHVRTVSAGAVAFVARRHEMAIGGQGRQAAPRAAAEVLDPGAGQVIAAPEDPEPQED